MGKGGVKGKKKFVVEEEPQGIFALIEPGRQFGQDCIRLMRRCEKPSEKGPFLNSSASRIQLVFRIKICILSGVAEDVATSLQKTRLRPSLHFPPDLSTPHYFGLPITPTLCPQSSARSLSRQPLAS